MEIDIKDVIEYSICSLRYRFRHIDKFPPYRPYAGTHSLFTGTKVYAEFDEAIHTMAAYIFHMVEGGRYPSAQTMKQKWGSIWLKEKDHLDTIQNIYVQEDERKQKEKMGLRMILDLLESYRGRAGIPILINRAYKVNVGKHVLKGTIDLVREINHQIEIVNFVTDDRTMRLYYHNDLETTAMAHAFRTMTQVEEDHIIYFGLFRKNRIETKRTKENIVTLLLILDQIEKAIEHEIFFPVLNSKCGSCPFLRKCNAHTWEKKEGKQILSMIK